MTLPEILKRLKTAGYKAEKRARGGREYIAIITEPGVDRPKFLKDTIAPLFKGTFKHSGNFSRRGEVSVGTVKIVAKEASKVNLVGFDARLFTKGGESTTLSYQGKEVKCFMFSSARSIEQSILAGAKGNSSLKGITESLEGFFSDGEFDWDGVEPAVIQKLAVYLGEVLIGWVGLSGQISKYISGATPFLNSKPVEFYVPDDPSFSGVDSFFKLKNGSLVAISSKSGAGRPGSFFSNILPAVLNMNVSGRTLKQLISIVKQKGVKPNDARSIVYEWGLNTLLKMNVSKPTQLLDELKARKKTKLAYQTAANIVDAMKPYMNDSSAKERTDRLPMSITSCFNYILAKRLEDSIDDIQNALMAKDYYQANLDIAEFLKGVLHYTLKKAGKAEVKLVYKQSPIEDVAARNGWVNYEIRKS